MEERRDLRKLIVPTEIDNTDEEQKSGNKSFNTTDLVFLDSYENQFKNSKLTNEERIVAPTDYAITTNAFVSSNYTNVLNQLSTYAWLRSA